MDVSALVVGAVLCMGAVLAVVIPFAIVAQRREKARQQALALWATQHEWQVVPKPHVDWGRRLPGGNKRGVSLALSGVVGGRPVTIAEYSYTTATTTNGTTSTTTHHFVLHVVVLREPMPTVAVYRRGGMSKLGRALFGDKATALGYEPFDRVYRVSAADPRLVRSVLLPALVTEHVAGRLPDWSLQGRELLSFRTGRIDDPATIPAELAPLVRVADLIENRG